MNEYRKQPISVAEQMAILKQRGLHFDDEAKATDILHSISYFRLSNYWRPLEQDKINHTFKSDSTFERVVALYEFDMELRNLLFPAIQKIEIALRTRLIQQVSSVHGSFWFADESVFRNREIFNHCLRSLKEEIARSKEDFIVDHFRNYTTPAYPLAWKSLEVSTFGTSSKLYCNLKDVKLKKKIARSFGLPQHVYFESWIKSLAVLRNCIAHHSRVWNRKFAWKPQMPQTLINPWITEDASTDRLYAQLCCISYLLDFIQPDNTFKKSLRSLIRKHSRVVDKAAMGFPKKWLSEPIWKPLARST